MVIAVREDVVDISVKGSDVEPIAIVGMSCRLPNNTSSPEEFWQLLLDGRITVGDVPGKRWEAYASSSPRIAAALSSATKRGSFLSDIENFDADFFGISAREAEYIDPQQRIILELSWEALEDAGIPPTSLKGKDVGVYVAANSFDFGQRLMSNLAEIQPWTMNGSMLFGIANRVSYALDFRGPSMVVDTACAGSLTVLHLACQALWSDEIPLAIVGGVNVMSNPGMMLALDAAGATAKDGRSKAFDNTANGYGRGEGAGLIVLKRLSRALEDHDSILALVRGGGIYQDGRTAGMMAPNPEAQETMLRKIYERFGISPASVGYVEAHGTGTQAGDKAEISAMSRVFGSNRDQVCLIGSAKPNIGHLEAGAGIVGIIKSVLVLRNEVIPPSVHMSLNGQIDWEQSGLRVVSEPTPWPRDVQPRRIGVSCFGVGGVISHAILEEAPVAPQDISGDEIHYQPQLSPALFPLSARSHAGLKTNARRLSDWMTAQPVEDLGPIGYTLSQRRDHLTKRAAIAASSRDDLIDGLRRLSDEAVAVGGNVITGDVIPGADKGAVWVFSGHGAQWSTMAQELLSTNACFAAVIDELGPIFQRELNYTARQAITESDWSTVERVQALTFAIQVGLSTVWKSIGLQPGAVIGHSVGEVAAAVVAGALTLEDAAVFACRRAVIYQRLAGKGGMAMARISYPDAQKKLAGNDRVVAAIAASPNGTIISGDTDALDEILAAWKKERIVTRKVSAIDAAFHSPQIDSLLGDIRAAAAHLNTRIPTVPLYNTTLDDPRSAAGRGPEFWATNSRGIVRLVDAVIVALTDGFVSFLEISTSPIVAPSIRDTMDSLGRDDVVVLGSLAPNKPEFASLVSSLAGLYVHGCPIDWSKFHVRSTISDLPSQAWQHRSYWPNAFTNAATRGFGHAPTSHTLLGQAEHVRSTTALTVWRTQLDYATRPYPGTHPLFGVEIVPAAALLYSLMTAAAGGDGLADLIDVNLYTPVPVDNPLDLQIVLEGHTINISSRREDVEVEHSWAWTTHTMAHVRRKGKNPIHTRDLTDLGRRCDETWTWEKVEALYRKRGIGGYGFPWKMLNLRRGGGEIFASFRSSETDRDARTWAEALDAALTICPLLLPDDELLRMPSRIGHVSAHGVPPEIYFVHAAMRAAETGGDEYLLDLEILNESGHVVGTMGAILFGVLDGAKDLSRDFNDISFVEQWVPYTPNDGDGLFPKRVAFIGAAQDCPNTLRDALSSSGVPFTFVDTASDLTPMSDLTVVVLGTGPRKGEDIGDAVERNAWALIETAQKLASPDFQASATRLLCLTKNVRFMSDEGGLTQSSLWGCSRIIAGERPDLWGGLFDLTTEPTDAVTARLIVSQWARPTNEDVISYAQGQLWVLRLAYPFHSGARQKEVGAVNECRPDATYLITGGLGALGLEAARFLIGKGARRIVLVGRNGLPPRSEWLRITDPARKALVDSICEMEESGVMILPLAADISDTDSFKGELDRLLNTLPPIKGIIHSAGIFEGGMIGQIDRAALVRSFAAKVRGALNIHRLFSPGSLDFLVLFSSSGQFGRLTGQTCYAAANSFLDGLARFRNGPSSTESLSVGWMAWRGLGMSRSIDATMIEAKARGLDAIDATSALKAWRRCEDLGVSYAAVFTPRFDGSAETLPVFSDLVRHVAEETPTVNDAFEIPTEGRLQWLVNDIRRLVAVELNTSENDVEVKRPLIDMGVDSLMTVSLRVRLRKRYGFEFPPTLLWNSPSVSAIAQFVECNIEEQAVRAAA